MRTARKPGRGAVSPCAAWAACSAEGEHPLAAGCWVLEVLDAPGWQDCARVAGCKASWDPGCKKWSLAFNALEGDEIDPHGGGEVTASLLLMMKWAVSAGVGYSDGPLAVFGLPGCWHGDQLLWQDP